MRSLSSATVRKVELVTPRLGEYTDISVQKDNITEYNHEFKDRFTFIGAANVLNKSYFSDEELRSIIANVRRYTMKPRSALLVLRTHEDGTNHGTLFSIDETAGCKILQRFGQGSEIENIVFECMGRP